MFAGPVRLVQLSGAAHRAGGLAGRLDSFSRGQRKLYFYNSAMLRIFKEAKNIKKICRAPYMILDDFCSIHPGLAGVFLWSRIFHILDKSDYRKTFH
jgi:hypothetical protein